MMRWQTEGVNTTRGDVVDGVVLVDKPAGWTSHDVVARLRRMYGTRRVGHAGTLDPAATGLLLVGVGRATRLLTHLVGLDKSYAATFRLGASTVTDDAEGEVISRADPRVVGDLEEEAVDGALAHFVGELDQIPSAVSAVRVNGVHAYARVRAGEAVSIPSRRVRIADLRRVGALRRDADGIEVQVEVDCSSGTYVRALARDLGTRLGVGGHVTALRRLRVGPFLVSEASTLPARDEPWESSSGLRLPVRGMAEVASGVFPTVTLTESEVAAVRHGRAVKAREGAVLSPSAPMGRSGSHDGAEMIAAVAEGSGALMAFVRLSAGMWRPQTVFVSGGDPEGDTTETAESA